MSDFKITDPTQGDLIIRTEESVSNHCGCRIGTALTGPYIIANNCKIADLQSQLEAARKTFTAQLTELWRDFDLTGTPNLSEPWWEPLADKYEAAKRENEQSDHLTVENTRLVSELAILNAENERLRADFEQRYKNACEKFDRRHAEDDEEIVRLNASLAEVTKEVEQRDYLLQLAKGNIAALEAERDALAAKLTHTLEARNNLWQQNKVKDEENAKLREAVEAAERFIRKVSILGNVGISIYEKREVLDKLKAVKGAR